MGARLIKYFGVAAQGNMDSGILFSIIAFRLPEFLTLLLPISFFIGVMLVFGRLYVDHEMAVLNGSGVSRDRLALKLLPFTFGLFVVHMVLMVWIAPWGNQKYDELTVQSAVRAGFDLIRPKEFVSSGRYVIYAGSFSEDKNGLNDLFFYQKSDDPNKPDMILVAKQARRVVTENGPESAVDLFQGRRYSIIPGQPKYLQAEFESYRLRLEAENTKEVKAKRIEAMSITEIWKKRDQSNVVLSELGWRFSSPFTMILALFLAVALAEVSPRQGRYHRIFPGVLIFASLIVALMAVKTRITKDKLGLWAYPTVLFVYAFLAWFLARKQVLAPKIKKHLGRGKA